MRFDCTCPTNYYCVPGGRRIIFILFIGYCDVLMYNVHHETDDGWVRANVLRVMIINLTLICMTELNGE